MNVESMIFCFGVEQQALRSVDYVAYRWARHVFISKFTTVANERRKPGT